MLTYTTLGTNNLDEAAQFYNQLLALLDATMVMDTESSKAWSTGDGPMFMVMKPGDGKAATVANGSMVSLKAMSPEIVDQVYAKALELGGKDEGGPRDMEMPGNSLRVAYFRDLDGHKLDVVYKSA